MKLLDHGASGIGVGLLVSLLGYFRSTKIEKKDASIDDFTRWLDHNRHKEIIEGQNNLLEILQGDGEAANIIKNNVQRLITHLQSFDHKIERIAQKVELLPTIENKVDLIIEEISKRETNSLKLGQVAICTKVLNIVTNELVGAGIKVVLESSTDMVKAGTILVCWQTGSKSPNMMLLDMIGNIDANRISIILNNNNSISLRVYDALGKHYVCTSEPLPSNQYFCIFTSWNNDAFSLRINGSRQGEFIVDTPFDYLGPFCLFGMDIDGKLSAEGIRWAPPGQPVGLQLYKDGICHDSLLDQILMYTRCLPEWQMDEFIKDPYLIYQK